MKRRYGVFLSISGINSDKKGVINDLLGQSNNPITAGSTGGIVGLAEEIIYDVLSCFHLFCFAEF